MLAAKEYDMCMTRKRELTELEKIECQKLRSIYESKKRDLGISQQTIADKLDVSQGAVSQYLNGSNALNLRAATAFADVLQVSIADFSERIEAERESFASSSPLVNMIREREAVYSVSKRDRLREFVELLDKIPDDDDQGSS